MSPALRCVLLVAVVSLTLACGEESRVLLRVESGLMIPDESDRLSVLVLAAEDRRELLSLELDLAAGEKFPLRVLLEPSADTPLELVEEITASLGEAPAARLTVMHTWRRGYVNEVELPPLAPVP